MDAKFDCSEYYLFGIKNNFLKLKEDLDKKPAGYFSENPELKALNEARVQNGLSLDPQCANATALCFLNFALGIYKPFWRVGMNDAARALMQEEVTEELLFTLSSMSLAVILGIYAKNEDSAFEYLGSLGTEVFNSEIFFPYYSLKFADRRIDSTKLAVEITAMLTRRGRELIEKQVQFEAKDIFTYAAGSAIKKTKSPLRDNLMVAYQADERIYGPYVLEFMKRFYQLTTDYIEKCCRTRR